MADVLNHDIIGIPINEVGKRLKQLNEAVEANNMAVGANNKIELECGQDEKVLAVQLTVYLFADKEEEKENGKM